MIFLRDASGEKNNKLGMRQPDSTDLLAECDRLVQAERHKKRDAAKCLCGTEIRYHSPPTKPVKHQSVDMDVTQPLLSELSRVRVVVNHVKEDGKVMSPPRSHVS